MDLAAVIQQLIQENTEAAKPTEVASGTVTSVSPLKIKVSVDLPDLSETFLILTDAVRAWDETVTIEYNGGTPQDAVIHHKGLQVGDKVVLLRVLKGQKYIVLSRA